MVERVPPPRGRDAMLHGYRVDDRIPYILWSNGSDSSCPRSGSRSAGCGQPPGSPASTYSASRSGPVTCVASRRSVWKAAIGVAAPVHAEDELVEVRLKVLAADPAVQGLLPPGPHVRRDEVEVAQHVALLHAGRSRLHDPLATVEHELLVRAEPVHHELRARLHAVLHEAEELGLALGGDVSQADAVGSRRAGLQAGSDLDGADDEELLQGLPRRPIVRRRADESLVDLDRAAELRARRRHHRSPQSMDHVELCLVVADPELALQLQRGGGALVGGDQVHRPESGPQPEPRAVHHRPCGHGRDQVAPGTPQSLAIRTRPASIVTAAPAHEAVGPKARREGLDTRLLGGELEREVGDAASVARTSHGARTLPLGGTVCNPIPMSGGVRGARRKADRYNSTVMTLCRVRASACNLQPARVRSSGVFVEARSQGDPRFVGSRGRN